MRTYRRAAERGRTQIGWLDSHHTFSFGGYHDPEHTAFGSLRVINDDRIAGGSGFGTHPHRDMEIITWVLDGSLAHADSMGHERSLEPGEAQVMSAGTGLTHSEYNGLDDDTSHFLQMWIMPRSKGIEPRYDQRRFPVYDEPGRLHLIATDEDEAEVAGALPINQDASLEIGRFTTGQTGERQIAPGRRIWLHVARGRVRVDGTELAAGDAVALEAESRVSWEALEDSELVLFDLA